MLSIIKILIKTLHGTQESLLVNHKWYMPCNLTVVVIMNY